MAARITTAARLGMAAMALTAACAAMSQPAPAPVDAKGAAPVAAAPPAAAAVPAGAELVAKGRELFANWSCNSCHSLADAGADGHVGPSLDGNPSVSHDFVKSRVTNGQGAMPAFGGQMTDAEIDTIATYIAQVAQKQ